MTPDVWVEAPDDASYEDAYDWKPVSVTVDPSWFLWLEGVRVREDPAFVLPWNEVADDA